MNSIKIYNTLTRTKETFEPVTPGQVGIYLCGPTVYDRAHIGHMVGPVVFDAIKRFLTYSGYDVTWVVNITDVDDKLINKARERGVSMDRVASEMTEDYLSNLEAMGVDQIDEMPRATDSMGDIIEFVRALVEQEFAYDVDGDVFFDVSKDSDYGKLTNRTVDDLRGEGGEAAARKRSASDFALWKRAKEDEPAWDSPWGPGRPGWHIECSAMSRSILGESFDIHGGGLDLIFPHHENEIAQSECRHGKPMAKYWMHNGLLRRDDAGKIGGRGDRDDSDTDVSLDDVERATRAKVSRSKGAGGLADMIQQIGGEQLRFFLLRTHYRSTVVYSDQALAEAQASLESFYRYFERFERVTGQSFYRLTTAASRADGEFDAGDDGLLETARDRRAAFLAKMDDDFNTGAAASELFELLRELNKFVDQHKLDEEEPDANRTRSLRRGTEVLRELSLLLGLFVKPFVGGGEADDELVNGLMDLLIDIRNSSRGKKDFDTADQIRNKLTELRITLEDRKDGTGWRRE
ncbi:MAG: cysteine--tRNA ligase [Pirellulaceae bacterium]|jgi:cysteinyl-tRNA synthetase|nr:cysteine--tRNA ligase [Pirellulaceae bacterium]MDP7018616.1 cysteine--tRNA ligase [Pirellulaceae bacterium]